MNLNTKKKKTFLELKEIFSTKPVLKMFDYEKQSIIKTDTSDRVLKIILNQLNKQERLHPIIYYLKRLQPAELNDDKKLLTIIDAFK